MATRRSRARTVGPAASARLAICSTTRACQARVLEHVAGRALAAGPTVRAQLRVVAIERDYGMFERAQAPH